MRAELLRTTPARILIVDDERHSTRLLEVILQPEGFLIDVATSGDEALAMMALNPPDLILLDIMMPGMDGYEVAARVRANTATKGIPIIMLSVLGDRGARMMGLDAGADDFLTKPVDRAELNARVRNLLRLKAYSDHHATYSQMLEGEVLARTGALIARSHDLELQAAALRGIEERTNFALAAAHMGIWEVQFGTDQVSWSDTMAQLFGLLPEQAPTSSADFFSLIHPEDRQAVQDNLAADVASGDVHEVEFRILWPDRSIHWVAGRARVIRDATGAALGILGVASDISSRKTLEAQFRQSQKMEAVGQLAGGVAHDFNNLLTAILGYSNFIMETFPQDDPRRNDMDEVLKAGNRAAALTHQLLAFSRKQILQPVTLSVNEVVTDMQNMLARLIGEHIQLVAVLSPDIGAVRTDRGQLEQVLMNLALNARDAMPSGGRLAIETANVELDQSCSTTAVVQPGPYVMLSVSDNGTGMSDTTRQRLFEPFYTTKEPGKGTGLGLATVYGIVHQSGGHVWVYSEPGCGATFKVYLPLVTAEGKLVTASGTGSVLPTATETVLLVEDDDSVRSLTRTILERGGYTVYDAASPLLAEGLFAEHRAAIKILVTDVIMPGASGPKLYERLVGLSPDLKVLYVSGYTDDAIVQQGELDPGIDFLQKPFTAATLNRTVRQVLERV